MTNKKIVRKPIDESEFIRVWARVFREGGRLQDVADELGCSYAGARLKSIKLLESGVKLPVLKIGRGPKVIDPSALNAELKAELAKK